jgi:hypothetical protein
MLEAPAEVRPAHHRVPPQPGVATLGNLTLILLLRSRSIPQILNVVERQHLGNGRCHGVTGSRVVGTGNSRRTS